MMDVIEFKLRLINLVYFFWDTQYVNRACCQVS